MLKASKADCEIMQYSQRKDFDQHTSHFHMNYEIYYLLSGRRRYIIDNAIYELEAGDIILIPPMVMHKTQKTHNIDEHHERILFDISEVPEVLKSVFEKNFYRPEGIFKEKIRELIDESVNEKEIGESSDFLHKINLFKILYILSKMPKDDNLPQMLSERDKIMQVAAGYIKENCHRQINLKEISSALGFAPEYFSSIFKQTIGLNFVDYLNNMRVALSLTYLSDTDMLISEISDKCGFNDSNYFTIVFKKVTGISPTGYRKLMKK